MMHLIAGDCKSKRVFTRGEIPAQAASRYNGAHEWMVGLGNPHPTPHVS